MFRRTITVKFEKAIKRSPVVLITGPRQSGKTTLVKSICKGYQYITFDDIRYLQAAKNDPLGFIQVLKKPVILDEIQRVPELFLSIKQDVDENRVNGAYVLTGSANPLLIPALGDSLAGRMEILKLLPLSQGELLGIEETFIDNIFKGLLPKSQKYSQEQLYKAIEIGGYPSAVLAHDQEDRLAWFESYVTTMLERDVKDIAHIASITDLHLLLRLLATRASSLVNSAELSRSSGISVTTLKRYLTLLEIIFFVYFQPTWAANLGKRLVKSPKLFLIDTGLLSFLLGITLQQTITPVFGQLVENFVINQLQKQATWSTHRVKAFHFRTTAGLEVDGILEDYAGAIVAFEIKNRITVSSADYKGLKVLQESVGNNFKMGIVFYNGAEIIPFGSQLYALPISSLWAQEFIS